MHPAITYPPVPYDQAELCWEALQAVVVFMAALSDKEDLF